MALHMGKKRKAVRKVKAALVKKKLKSMISAMKCKHARSKQSAHVAKHQVKKLVKVVAKLIKAKKAAQKAAKTAIKASAMARKAEVASVKATAKTTLNQMKVKAKAAIKVE